MEIAEMVWNYKEWLRKWESGLLPALVGANAMKIAAFGALIAERNYFQVFLYKVVVCGALSVLVFRLLLFPKSRAPLFLFYLLQSLYLFAVLVYFEYSTNYLTLAQMAQMAGEGWGLVSKRALLFHPLDFLLFLDFPVLCLYLARHPQARSNPTLWQTRWRRAVIASVGVLTAVEAVNYRMGKSLWSADHTYESASVVRRYGTLANSLVRFLKYPSETALLQSLDYGPIRIGPPVSNEKPNFLLIQIESLGSDVLKAFYKGLPITPNLRRLAQEGVFHPYALSYHKGGGSSDAEFSILNSVEPFDHFVGMKLRNYNYPNSLIRQLKELGYSAQAFHGNHKDFYSRRLAYHKMGFDRFHDMEAMGLEEVGWGAPDREVFGFLEAKIKEEEKPFFYYLITMSSHEPFHFHLKDAEAEGFEEVKEAQVRDYLRSMAYVDRVIGDFVDRLRKGGMKNTFVILFGDHPSPVDGKYYRNSTLRVGEAFLEFVPIILLTPQGNRRVELGTVASYLDVGFTVLEAAGGGFRIRSRGSNLLEHLAPEREQRLRGRVFNGTDLFRLASAPDQTTSPVLEFIPWQEDGALLVKELSRKKGVSPATLH